MAETEEKEEEILEAEIVKRFPKTLQLMRKIRIEALKEAGLRDSE